MSEHRYINGVRDANFVSNVPIQFDVKDKGALMSRDIHIFFDLIHTHIAAGITSGCATLCVSGGDGNLQSEEEMLLEVLKWISTAKYIYWQSIDDDHEIYVCNANKTCWTFANPPPEKPPRDKTPKDIVKGKKESLFGGLKSTLKYNRNKQTQTPRIQDYSPVSKGAHVIKGLVIPKWTQHPNTKHDAWAVMAFTRPLSLYPSLVWAHRVLDRWKWVNVGSRPWYPGLPLGCRFKKK